MIAKTLIISIFLNLTLFTNDDITEQISTGLKTGNAKLLSNYFDDNIRMKIGKNDNIYSRTQATIILQDFFKKNKPTQYKVTTLRKKENLNITIGTLITEKQTYRIYYQTYLKKKQKKITYFYIQSLQN